MRLTVVTDDLTGQLGLASLLRSHGVRAELDTVHDETGISVLNTRTRDVREELAAAAVAGRIREVGVRPDTLWVKRIDSMLRGPIAAELDAMITIVGATGGVLAPANPLARRVTVNGEHFVHGRRVGDLTGLLRHLPGVRSVRVGGEFSGDTRSWWIPDATHPLDIDRIGRTIPLDPRFLVVDSGALTAAVSARCLDTAEGVPHAARMVRPGVVVVQGSTSALVAQQVRFLRKCGVEAIEIFHRGIAGPSDPALHGFAAAAAARISPVSSAGTGLVIVGGGLTAEALLPLAGIDVQDLDVLPAPGTLVGLARVRAGRHAGLLVATKGGQVGPVGALADLVSSFRVSGHQPALPELTVSR